MIEKLPLRDRARLLAACEDFPLVLADVLCEAQQPTGHVYFPTAGFISLVTVAPNSPGLEVGMVGREGMVGSQLALGVVNAPVRSLVQGAGSAWRIGAQAFKAELVRSPALQRVLCKYVYVLMAQLAGSAACLRFHQIGPRLARWLLMSHDRAGTDAFHVTHAFLAYMLGMRRVGITGAAHELQRRGLIEYHRGELKVLDRAGLEATACGCYEADRRIYGEVLA